MPALSSPPTLYEWAGGMPALQRLTAHFYERVRVDPVLATVFAQMPGDHPSHVAQFIAEVLGGPSTYSATRGGHPHMITQHLNRHLTQERRRRWLELLLASADATHTLREPSDATRRAFARMWQTQRDDGAQASGFDRCQEGALNWCCRGHRRHA